MELRTAVRSAILMLSLLAFLGCPPPRPPVVAPQPPGPVPRPGPAQPPPTVIPESTPAPTPLPREPEPLGSFPEPMEAPLVRVLLERPGDPQLPEVGRRFAVVDGAGVRTEIRGPVRITLAGAEFVLQVGAFSREDNARSFERGLLAAGIGARVEAGPDGVFRVFAAPRSGETEASLRSRLAASGVAQALRSMAGQPGGAVALESEGGRTLVGEVFRIAALDPSPIRVGGISVRGELIVRALPGRAGVINQLNLEVYLRGVVPAEMGPRMFPALEALKAQAVAARTYAAARMLARRNDPFDVHDTVASQVYGGVGVEHPLSDQAVLETARLVATYQGQPIDAMYHSTCGGHTEDAAAVFPRRAAPYLQGVPCRHPGESLVLPGTVFEPGPWVGEAERLALVARALAGVLGVAAEPRSLSEALGRGPGGEGLAGLLKAFGLEPMLDTLLRESGGSEGREVQVARLLAVAGLPLPAFAGDRGTAELALVIRLAQLANRVQNHHGRIGRAASGLQLLSGDLAREVPAGAMVLERLGARWRLSPVATAPGAPATLWCAGERCAAVEVEQRWQADGNSSWAWWVREIPLEEIASRLELPAVDGLEVTRRGRSGRALGVRTLGRNAFMDHDAYPFRLNLGLPDTLFVVTVEQRPGGPVARFTGRGFGHGVGMCQHGAFGLAQGGAGFLEILGTYYRDIRVEEWRGW